MTEQLSSAHPSHRKIHIPSCLYRPWSICKIVCISTDVFDKRLVLANSAVDDCVWSELQVGKQSLKQHKSLSLQIR